MLNAPSINGSSQRMAPSRTCKRVIGVYRYEIRYILINVHVRGFRFFIYFAVPFLRTVHTSRTVAAATPPRR